MLTVLYIQAYTCCGWRDPAHRTVDDLRHADHAQDVAGQVTERGRGARTVSARPRQSARRRPGCAAGRGDGSSLGRSRHLRDARRHRCARGQFDCGHPAPGADFCTRNDYPDALALLDAGVTVALGADCNPGTSYTTSLPFCIAIAVRDMHMTPDEAVRAATAGGAAALRRTDVGSLRIGARADAVVLDAPSHLHLAYRPGVPLVGAVFKDGLPRTADTKHGAGVAV